MTYDFVCWGDDVDGCYGVVRNELMLDSECAIYALGAGIFYGFFNGGGIMEKANN